MIQKTVEEHLKKKKIYKAKGIKVLSLFFIDKVKIIVSMMKTEMQLRESLQNGLKRFIRKK